MPNLLYPGHFVLDKIDVVATMRIVEEAYRICYKSEGKMDDAGFNEKFIQNKIAIGHLSPLEHTKLTFKFVCDRGISHELVRHRIASFAQESTRYCNYENGRVNVIVPGFWDPLSPIFRHTNPNHKKCLAVWLRAANQSEENYNDLMDLGATPQEARSVLLTSNKTEIIITMNFRELRHFFLLRAEGVTGQPHPQMKEITIPFLLAMQELFPVVFGDIKASY